MDAWRRQRHSTTKNCLDHKLWFRRTHVADHSVLNPPHDDHQRRFCRIHVSHSVNSSHWWSSSNNSSTCEMVVDSVDSICEQSPISSFLAFPFTQLVFYDRVKFIIPRTPSLARVCVFVDYTFSKCTNRLVQRHCLSIAFSQWTLPNYILHCWESKLFSLENPCLGKLTFEHTQIT